MNQNNGNHRLAAVDVIDEEVASERTNGNFYDASNPELRPAKPIGVTKKKGWKRKLVAWCIVLLLIGGGAIVLYLLLRVNRVDVKVQADSRRDLQTPKPSPNGNNPDNTLTAEAINIARSASGADSVNNNAAPSASPSAAALSSPTPVATSHTNYSYTGNTSPVFEPLTEATSNGNSNQQTTAGRPQAAAIIRAFFPCGVRSDHLLSVRANRPCRRRFRIHRPAADRPHVRAALLPHDPPADEARQGGEGDGRGAAERR